MKKLIESTTAVKFTKRLNESENSAVKWSAPIWNLDEVNLNGHTYTRELAEYLVRENKTTVAHDGHQDERGEYTLAKAVCSNPHIKDNQLWVDIEFVDKDYEEKINTLIEKGISIGVSSTGWAEDTSDGVLTSSNYILLRYLDFVEMPASNVYLEKGQDEKDTDVEPDVAPAMAEEKASLSKSYAILENKIQNLV